MKMMRTIGLLALVLMSGAAQAQAGVADTIRDTLAKGADPNGWVKQELGFRTHPLHMVAAVDANTPARVKDQLEAMRLLVEAGAKVNGRDDFGNTPLHRAVSALNPKAAKWLIRHGADVNARNDSGQTPIHELDTAASYLNNQHPSAKERERMTRDMKVMAVLLIHHGAKLDVRDEEGRTPLNLLAANAPGGVIEELLSGGARVDARDKRGETPLARAVRWNNDPGAARALLRRGAKADARLLMEAIRNDRIAQAMALIHSGMDVNGADKTGDTPLMEAVTRTVAMRGDIEPRLKLIRALLDAGADPKAKNRLGATPFGLAHEDRRVLALFTDADAEESTHRKKQETTRKAVKRRKGKAGKKKKEPMEAGVDAAIDRLGKLMKEADDLETPALDAADIRSLPDMRAIAGRIRTLERFVRASKQLAGFLQHGGEFAWQRAKDAGASREEADAAAEVFSKALSPEVFNAMLDRTRANIEWASLTIRAYRLLQQHPDKWRFGRKGEKHLMVTDREFARKLGDLSRRMKQAGARADSAYERMKAAMKKK